MSALLFADLPVQQAPDDVDKFASTMTRRDRRPGPSLPVVRHAVALALGPEVLDWVNQDGVDPMTLAAVVADLEAHLQPCRDGFELCDILKSRAHWQPDSDLVDILDAAAFHFDRTQERLVRGWVKAHGVRLALSVGDRAETQRGPGEITGLRPETACYLVRLDADADAKTAGAGWIFQAERVAPLPAAA